LENQEIARVLWETADLMEIAGEDSFRIRSYRNGATVSRRFPASAMGWRAFWRRSSSAAPRNAA
jgi:DNA polymerase (family 10)